MTISAVSQQIKLLEAQLGVPLFDRLGRRVQLTAEGGSLAAALRPAFMQIDDALAQLDRDRNTACGLVRIGMPGSFGEHFEQRDGTTGAFEHVGEVPQLVIRRGGTVGGGGGQTLRLAGQAGTP